MAKPCYRPLPISRVPYMVLELGHVALESGLVVSLLTYLYQDIKVTVFFC